MLSVKPSSTGFSVRLCSAEGSGLFINLSRPLDAFFFTFPVIFGEDYGWNDGLVGLTFIPVLFGVAIALVVTPRLEVMYHKAAKQKGGKADPEDRLPGMMLGAPLIPIGQHLVSLFSGG
jgi:hypothetical protein